MTTIPNAKYQFKIEGVWPKPDIAVVQAFFRDHVLAFLEPTTPIASVVHGDAIKEEVRFNSAEAWLSGLAADMRSASFASYGPRHDVSLNWTLPGGLVFSATGDEPSRDAARALVEAAQTVFHVAPRELPGRSSVSGTYRCAKRPDAAWLAAAIALIEGLGAGASTATYRLASSSHIRRTTRIGELQERMRAGDPLIDWSITAGGASLFYMANGNVSVTAGGESDDAILAFISEAQRKLDLIPVADRTSDDAGGFTRRSFMQEHPTAAWFDRLLPALARATGNAGSFTGRLRTVSNEDMTFRAFGRWRSELEAKWDRLATAGLWQDGADGSVNVDVDLRRELVTVIFNLRSTADVESVNKQFQDACGLNPAAPDVYKYRKYSRTYNIGEWSSTAEYGRAVQRAIDKAFDSRPVVVMNAFAESGEVTPLESFQTVQEFTDYFAKEPQFRNASLIVEGFGGRHLGIHVDRAKKTFQILGNLDLDLFNEADKQFRNAFTRSGKKDEPGAAAPGASEIWKAYLASAVSIAVALIAAAWSFVSAGRESPDLKIVYPGDKAEVQGSTLDVQWTYRDPRVFGRPAWYANYPADVQVLESGKLAQTVRGAPGHAKLTGLHPGACTIIVSAPAGPSDSRQIMVAPPAVRPARVH